MAKNIITKLALNEISGVDIPAQAPALAALMKNKDGTSAAMTEEFIKQLFPREDETRAQFTTRFMRDREARDEYPTESARRSAAGRLFDLSEADKRFGVLSSANEHQHVIDIMGPEGLRSRGLTTYDHGHVHEWVRDPVTGMVTILEIEGHTHDVVQSVRIPEDPIEMMVAGMGDEDGMEVVMMSLSKQGVSLPGGRFPIANRTDLRNAIRAFGRADRSDRREVARHIRRRASALDALDLLPEEGVLADLLKSASSEEAVDNTANQKEDIMSGNTTKSADPIVADLSAKLAKANSIVALSTDHRAHYDTLIGESAQESFLGKSVADRAADVEKNADGVVYTTRDGVDVMKSHGDLMLQMAKNADTHAAALEESTLSKSVSTNMGAFSGPADLKLDVARALSKSLDADKFKATMEMFGKTAAAANLLGKSYGTSLTGNDEPEDDSQEAVEKSGTMDAIKAMFPTG